MLLEADQTYLQQSRLHMPGLPCLRPCMVMLDLVQCTGQQAAMEIFAFHKGPIRAMRADVDARALATGSEDCSAALWDIRNPGQPMHVLQGHTDW
jgi:WD40 repeat protein